MDYDDDNPFESAKFLIPASIVFMIFLVWLNSL
jgi:hypothetical protein